MKKLLDRRRTFADAVSRICAAAGGVRVGGTAQTIWEVETLAGTLQVCPIETSNTPWIACRFLEPGRVSALGGQIDICDGKWNFRLWAEWERAESPGWEPAFSNGLKHFEACLRVVTPPPRAI